MSRFLLAVLTTVVVPAAVLAQHPHDPPPEPVPTPSGAEEEPPDHGDHRPDEPERQPPPHEPAHAPDAAPFMPAGPLGIPAAREGSGTSWLPDASPMHAIHEMHRGWLSRRRSDSALGAAKFYDPPQT